MSFEALDRYRALRDRKELTVRLRCSQGVASLGDIQKIEGHIRSVAQMPEHRDESDWLRIIGIKMFLDGGMLTGSAYMREPWGVSELYGISDPAYRGVLFIPRDRLLPMVRTAVENGLQFTAHSQGDGAVHALLDVYDELSREGLAVKETRCCITHSSFMSPEAIASAARLGVMVDLQPAWLYCDAATLRGHFGLERLRWFIPLQSLFKAGVNVGGGSDHMQKIGSLRSINPYNPFLGIATAIGRRPRGEAAPLHVAEALNRQQALRFYTANNAALLFLEKRVGSLEPGKLADFAILDTDLLTSPEEQIGQTRAWRTYVGGKLVYSRAEPD
jgi:predicted amidohydrolase YtcJ